MCMHEVRACAQFSYREWNGRVMLDWWRGHGLCSVPRNCNIKQENACSDMGQNISLWSSVWYITAHNEWLISKPGYSLNVNFHMNAAPVALGHWWACTQESRSGKVPLLFQCAWGEWAPPSHMLTSGRVDTQPAGEALSRPYMDHNSAGSGGTDQISVHVWVN